MPLESYRYSLYYFWFVFSCHSRFYSTLKSHEYTHMVSPSTRQPFIFPFSSYLFCLYVVLYPRVFLSHVHTRLTHSHGTCTPAPRNEVTGGADFGWLRLSLAPNLNLRSYFSSTQPSSVTKREKNHPGFTTVFGFVIIASNLWELPWSYTEWLHYYYVRIFLLLFKICIRNLTQEGKYMHCNCWVWLSACIQRPWRAKAIVSVVV